MYIRKLKIENIRSIKSLEWILPKSQPAAGWHVIVGDIGSGKTTFLRSIALAMIGPLDAAPLRLSWDDWLRKGETSGRIALTIRRNREIDKYSRRGKTPTARLLSFGVYFRDVGSPEQPLVRMRPLRSPIDTGRHVWGDGMGWFCTGYGPFRPFIGGDAELGQLALKQPRLARFLSLFDERFTPADGLEWLRTLPSRPLEMRRKARRLAHNTFLARLIQFINQPDFLPLQAQLTEITAQQVVFVDANQNAIRIEQWNDGFDFIFGLALELIRQFSIVYGPDAVFAQDDPGEVACEGVVLIDDVDVHLGPVWQRRVGSWFRKHFPNIQFLVSTRSPIIGEAADVDSIFRLPRPGDERALSRP
jgi:hypothetical protein